MKNSEYITSVEDLIASTETLLKDKNSSVLFRGQPNNDPLLPKVARKNPKNDTTDLEKKIVKEFRRRLARERDIAAMDDWDLLVFAQHHGLCTRLLDWTSNPLFALWFACSDRMSTSDVYIFMLLAKDEMLLDPSTEKDPFKIKKTYVLKPNINSSRIRAQSGWFTVHPFSEKDKRFVDLHKNKSIKGSVLMKGIRHANKPDILKTLDKLGVNQESVFPGPEGTANYVNWLYRDDL